MLQEYYFFNNVGFALDKGEAKHSLSLITHFMSLLMHSYFSVSTVNMYMHTCNKPFDTDSATDYFRFQTFNYSSP